MDVLREWVDCGRLPGGAGARMTGVVSVGIVKESSSSSSRSLLDLRRWILVVPSIVVETLARK